MTQSREAICIRCRDEHQVDQALLDMPADNWDLVSAMHVGDWTYLYFKRTVNHA